MYTKPASHYKKNQRSNYRQLGLIGQGQFGQVFCGIHRQSGKLVALKDLHPQRFPTHKFLREVRILMSLRHPNIVSCQGVEHHKQGRYLVMDYCEGGTLRDIIDSQGQINPVIALKLISDILAGLAHAHQQEIIHCDLKPENILLNLTSQSWIARITDFGVARLLREDQGGSASGLGDTGSPAYMAPERYYGKYSAASDLYAVGVILFELITGKRPFSGLPGELMAAHISRPLVIPNLVPEVIRPLIKKAMEKLISRRYTSALEMLKEVKEAQAILSKNYLNLPRFSPPNLKYTEQSVIIIAEEKLEQSVIDIIPINNCLYLGIKNEIIGKKYEQEILNSNLKQQWRINLKTDFLQFKAILSSSQFYSLIKGQHPDHYGLYACANQPPIKPLKILSGVGDFNINSVENQGKWWAMIEQDAKQNTVYLKINHSPQLPSIKIKLNPPYPQEIIPLDAHYGLLICPNQKQENQGKIFTRKGRFIYNFTLPIQWQKLIPHLTTPYRYFCVTKDDEQLGFLIDFKPYRLLPISLGIKPDFIVSIPQGFALFNENGRGVILDHDGQQTHKFKLPAKPLIVKAYSETYLLIVTQINEEIKILLCDYQKIYDEFSSSADLET